MIRGFIADACKDAITHTSENAQPAGSCDTGTVSNACLRVLQNHLVRPVTKSGGTKTAVRHNARHVRNSRPGRRTTFCNR